MSYDEKKLEGISPKTAAAAAGDGKKKKREFGNLDSSYDVVTLTNAVILRMTMGRLTNVSGS